jgi:hypothetical protein
MDADRHRREWIQRLPHCFIVRRFGSNRVVLRGSIGKLGSRRFLVG